MHCGQVVLQCIVHFGGLRVIRNILYIENISCLQYFSMLYFKYILRKNKEVQSNDCFI